MVQIIAGNKGKGKTKYLLDMANTAVKESKGSIVYLDKSAKHMYELNNKIRLINVQEYPITSSEGFIGFLCGIICQDHDLEQMYLDSFLKLSSWRARISKRPTGRWRLSVKNIILHLFSAFPWTQIRYLRLQDQMWLFRYKWVTYSTFIRYRFAMRKNSGKLFRAV